MVGFLIHDPWLVVQGRSESAWVPWVARVGLGNVRSRCPSCVGSVELKMHWCCVFLPFWDLPLSTCLRYALIVCPGLPSWVAHAHWASLMIFQCCASNGSKALCCSVSPCCLFPQFNFLNCFASLFYIAFVLKDMKLLRQVSIKHCFYILMWFFTFQ